MRGMFTHTNFKTFGTITDGTSNTGGVNVMFMDGSVHFVSDTVNTGNLDSDQGGMRSGTGTQPINSGGSNYGIWGALGTPAAGSRSRKSQINTRSTPG